MVEIKVSEECYNELRRLLIAQGDGGVFNERAHRREIDMTGVTVYTRGKQDATSPPRAD